MLKLLFSPDGRIPPADFIRGGLVLILIGVALQLSALISFKFMMIMSIPSLVLYWCWAVLWVKRFHDSGQSGWMCLLAILVWIIVGGIVSQIVQMMFLGDLVEESAEMLEAMEDMDPDDIGSIFSSMFGMMDGMMKKMAIPNAISSTLVSLGILYGGNALIKHDPNDNKYGPESIGSVFN